jgi:K+-transporting ATPase ATPase A chain
MNTEILGIIAMFAITLVIGIFLGKYIANVYGYKKLFRSGFQPIEKLIYKISGINPNRQMNWKQNMYAMLAINLVWFIIGFILF